MFSKTMTWTLASVVLALAASACSTSSNAGADACDTMCADVPGCGDATCLSRCIAAEAACSLAGESSSFQAWASCGPQFVCVDGAYQTLNCAHESDEVASCGGGHTSHDAGRATGSEGGTKAGLEGGNLSEGGSRLDSGMHVETGAGSEDDADENDTGLEMEVGSAHDTGTGDSSIPSDTGVSDVSVARDGAASDASPAHDTGTPDTSPAQEAGPEAGTCLSPSNDPSCASAADCPRCCESDHCSGSMEYNLLYEACVCESGDPCASACASDFCTVGFIETTECSNCLSGISLGNCAVNADNTCNANGDCLAYQRCLQSECGE